MPEGSGDSSGLLLRLVVDPAAAPFEVRRDPSGATWAGTQSTTSPWPWVRVPENCEPVLCGPDFSTGYVGLVGLLPTLLFPKNCAVTLVSDEGMISAASVAAEAWIIAYEPYDIRGSWIEWRDATGEVFATRRLSSTSGYIDRERRWGTTPKSDR